MLASFTHDIGGKSSLAGHEPVIEDLAHWVLKLALNVIATAGFDIQIPWSTHSVEAGDLATVSSSGRMSLQQNVPILMENLALLVMSPWWMLRWSPIPLQKRLNRASNEFVAYMNEIFLGHQAESEMNKTSPSTEQKPRSARLQSGDLLHSRYNNVVLPMTC